MSIKSIIDKIKSLYYSAVNTMAGYKKPGKVRQLRAELENE